MSRSGAASPRVWRTVCGSEAPTCSRGDPAFACRERTACPVRPRSNRIPGRAPCLLRPRQRFVGGRTPTGPCGVGRRTYGPKDKRGQKVVAPAWSQGERGTGGHRNPQERRECHRVSPAGFRFHVIVPDPDNRAGAGLCGRRLGQVALGRSRTCQGRSRVRSVHARSVREEAAWKRCLLLGELRPERCRCHGGKTASGIPCALALRTVSVHTAVNAFRTDHGLMHRNLLRSVDPRGATVRFMGSHRPAGWCKPAAMAQGIGVGCLWPSAQTHAWRWAYWPEVVSPPP